MYVSPSGEFPQYSGDIERDNPGWVEGDSLPDGWIKVSNDTPPSAFFTWPELEEGQTEDNTAPITETIYKPTLNTEDYSVVWVEVVVDFVQPEDVVHPHEIGLL